MTFKISSGELFSLLQNQSKVLPSVYNEMPILTYYLFEIIDKQLYVTGSDGVMRSRGVIPIIESDGDTSFAVFPKDLLEYVRDLPDQPLTFDYDAEQSLLSMSFNGGYIRFATSDADLYPKDDKDREEAKTAHVATLSAASLRRGLELTIGSIFAKEARPVLSSICFDFKPKYLAMVATTGEILTKFSNFSVTDPSIVESSDVRVQSPYQFLLPQKMANFLRTLLAHYLEEDVVVSHSDRKAFFKVGNIEASTRLVEGRYPVYDSVIPQDNPYRISIESRLFLPALKRMNSFMGMDKDPMDVMIAGNEMTVTMRNTSMGDRQAEEHFTVDNPANVTMKLRFNVSSFITLISTIDSEHIVFGIADQSRAMLIIPSENAPETELINIIMPQSTAR
ncbi:MAG: DNA polymerase III subunit beta [Bacteroidales bacterium]|nr:DNA polymerase III subunit beta [Porphyromonas sp.]MDD6935103.1 DNA polymerase III subunit beta [Bacteroidales bacterium]MDY3102351.1 DNA polymerase III subunit beta [Porphyromonas sp.]